MPKVYGTCKCLFIPLNRLRIQVLCHLLDTWGPVTRFLPWKNVPLVSQLRRIQIWFFCTERPVIIEIYMKNNATQNSVLIPSLPILFWNCRRPLWVQNTGVTMMSKANYRNLLWNIWQQNHAYLTYICTHPLKPSRNRHDDLKMWVTKLAKWVINLLLVTKAYWLGDS